MSVVPSPAIRRAETADVEVVQHISADAYVPAYQNVIGAVPKPAFEDYAPRIERGEAWVLEVDGKPVGVAILEEKPDHLLVYSIAVTPDEQRKGHAEHYSASQTSEPWQSASGKFASTPTGG